MCVYIYIYIERERERERERETPQVDDLEKTKLAPNRRSDRGGRPNCSC